MKDIEIWKSTQIHLRSGFQEVKAGLSHGGAAFTGQHAVKNGLQLVQIQNVTGGIIHLCLCQLGGTPVRGLLLFGYLYIDQLVAEVL